MSGVEFKFGGPEFRFKHPYHCGRVLHAAFPDSRCLICGETFNTRLLIDQLVVEPQNPEHRPAAGEES